MDFEQVSFAPDLPKDVLRIIFSSASLRIIDLFQVLQVCKSWRQVVIQNDEFLFKDRVLSKWKDWIDLNNRPVLSWRIFFLQIQERVIQSSLRECRFHVEQEEPEDPFKRGFFQLMKRAGVLLSTEDVYEKLQSGMINFIRGLLWNNEKLCCDNYYFSHLILDSFNLSLAFRARGIKLYGFYDHEPGLKCRLFPDTSNVTKIRRVEMDENQELELELKEMDISQKDGIDEEDEDEEEDYSDDEVDTLPGPQEWDSIDLGNDLYRSHREQEDTEDDYTDGSPSEGESDELYEKARKEREKSLMEIIEQEQFEIANNPNYQYYQPKQPKDLESLRQLCNSGSDDEDLYPYIPDDRGYSSEDSTEEAEEYRREKKREEKRKRSDRNYRILSKIRELQTNAGAKLLLPIKEFQELVENVECLGTPPPST